MNTKQHQDSGTGSSGSPSRRRKQQTSLAPDVLSLQGRVHVLQQSGWRGTLEATPSGPTRRLMPPYRQSGNTWRFTPDRGDGETVAQRPLLELGHVHAVLVQQPTDRRADHDVDHAVCHRRGLRVPAQSVWHREASTSSAELPSDTPGRRSSSAHVCPRYHSLISERGIRYSSNDGASGVCLQRRWTHFELRRLATLLLNAA